MTGPASRALTILHDGRLFKWPVLTLPAVVIASLALFSPALHWI